MAPWARYSPETLADTSGLRAASARTSRHLRRAASPSTPIGGLPRWSITMRSPDAVPRSPAGGRARRFPRSRSRRAHRQLRALRGRRRPRGGESSSGSGRSWMRFRMPTTRGSSRRISSIGDRIRILRGTQGDDPDYLGVPVGDREHVRGVVGVVRGLHARGIDPGPPHRGQRVVEGVVPVDGREVRSRASRTAPRPGPRRADARR